MPIRLLGQEKYQEKLKEVSKKFTVREIKCELPKPFAEGFRQMKKICWAFDRNPVEELSNYGKTHHEVLQNFVMSTVYNPYREVRVSVEGFYCKVTMPLPHLHQASEENEMMSFGWYQKDDDNFTFFIRVPRHNPDVPKFYHLPAGWVEVNSIPNWR